MHRKVKKPNRLAATQILLSASLRRCSNFLGSWPPGTRVENRNQDSFQCPRSSTIERGSSKAEDPVASTGEGANFWGISDRI